MSLLKLYFLHAYQCIGIIFKYGPSLRLRRAAYNRDIAWGSSGERGQISIGGAG